MGALTADEQLTNMCFDKTVQSAQQDFGQEHQQEAAPQQEGIGAALGNFAHRVLDVPVAALRVGGTLLRKVADVTDGTADVVGLLGYQTDAALSASDSPAQPDNEKDSKRHDMGCLKKMQSDTPAKGDTSTSGTGKTTYIATPCPTYTPAGP